MIKREKKKGVVVATAMKGKTGASVDVCHVLNVGLGITCIIWSIPSSTLIIGLTGCHLRLNLTRCCAVIVHAVVSAIVRAIIKICFG